MKRRTLLVVLVSLVVASASLAFYWSRPRQSPAAAAAAAAPDHSEHGTTRADVTLDSRRQQLIGVRTATARQAAIAPEIRAAGTVTYDETRQAEINTRVDGWIRELYADYTGKPVRRGETLFTLYSPDLIATQNEYLLAMRGQSHAGHAAAPDIQDYSDRLVAAARERLLRLDVTEQDIEQLRASGKPAETINFRSPATGVIVEKAAVRGMRVMAGQTLFRVADLSTVWAEAEIYEQDLAAVRVGTRATIAVQAYPDRTFAGRVSYISPIVTPETRTVRTRVTLPNPGGLLKPNMVATVQLQSPATPAVVVPVDAVVATGTQQVVFVTDGAGRFTPREVRVGRRTATDVEVLSGLTAGEQVAASATFFIDSESQLRGALQNYQAAPTEHAARDAAQGIEVTFRSEPERPTAGETTMVVTLKDAAGRPVTDAQLSVRLFMPAMPSMNMPAMKTEAKLGHARDGVYRGTVMVPTSGRWDVTVTAAKEGRTVATRQFALMVR